MYVWKIEMKEVENNPLDEVFSSEVVLADTFDDAIGKVRQYNAETWKKTKLEIVKVERLWEVDIE